MKTRIPFWFFVAVVSLAVLPQAQAWPNGHLTNTKNTTTTTSGYCIITTTNYTNWTYTDSSGGAHLFAASSQVVTARSTNPKFNCSAYNDVVDIQAWSTDGKGYYLTTTNGVLGSVTITATIFPTYEILSLLYDPPGNQSNVGITNTTFYGTTNTIGSSFSSGTSFTFVANGGFFGLGGGTSSSVGFTQGYGTSNAFQNTITNGQGITLNSTRNPIDHTNDTFWLWLNPEVAITETSATAATYAVSPPRGQVIDAVRVSVAQLQNPSTIPLPVLEPITINGIVYPGLSNLCAHPLPPAQCTQANACGCVPSDFTQILGTDPIISITGNASPTTIDPKRYFFLNPQPSPQPFLEYGTTDTVTLSDSQQATQTQTETTQYQASYSTTFGTSVKSFPVDWTLQSTITNTWTWTQTASLDHFNGSSHQMSLTLGTSTLGCAESVDVYEDYIYHTFVATTASVPPPACD